MKNKLERLLQSRRFYASLLALSVIILQDGLGLSHESSMTISSILMVWVLGDSLNKT